MSPIRSEKFNEDLAYLMGCLSEVLKETGYGKFLGFIPDYSQGSAFLGQHTPEQIQTLGAAKVAQLYSIAFQLLNMAEENMLVQNRRKQPSSEVSHSEAGLWPEVLQRLQSNGMNADGIKKLLRNMRIEAVLTAHPTEAKRSTVLEHHRELYLALVKKENQMWSPMERKWLKEDIKSILETLWRTGEIYLQRPDIASERRNILHYLKNVFPEVIPLVDRRFESAWEEAGLAGKPSFKDGDYPSFLIGTWVGGDRDGHPFVDAAVTKKSLESLRLNALIVLRHRLVALAKKASFSSSYQQPTQSLLTRLEYYKNGLLKEVFPAAQRRNPGEPWRVLISLMIERMPIEVVRDHATQLDQKNFSYGSPRELLEDLWILHESFLEIGAEALAYRELRDTVRCVQVFGFHSAKLDIRQNSAKHEAALKQLFDLLPDPPKESRKESKPFIKNLKPIDLLV